MMHTPTRADASLHMLFMSLNSKRGCLVLMYHQPGQEHLKALVSTQAVIEQADFCPRSMYICVGKRSGLMSTDV